MPRTIRTYTLGFCLMLIAGFPPPVRLYAGQIAEQQPDTKQQQPSDNGSVEKSDPASPPAGNRSRSSSLASMAAFDRVYLKGRKDPLTVHSTLPRPFNPSLFRRGETLNLKPYRADRPESGATIGVKAEEITKVEFFEELLMQEGDRCMTRRDFAGAFDSYARLV